MRNNIYYFGELWRFFRIETCFFISGIAAFGYLMFNSVDIALFYVMLSVFMASAASYAHNHITDKKEDAINNKRLNLFARGPLGIAIIIATAATGLFVSSMLSPTIMALYVFVVSMALLYNGLRIKKLFIIKNLYCGMSICVAFLIGVMASGYEMSIAFSYMPSVFMFGFLINLLGDIRGVEGDSNAGVKTIPSVMGVTVAKIAVYAAILLFIMQSTLLSLVFVYPLIPFMVLLMYFVYVENHKGARFSILSSFSTLPFILTFLNAAGI